MAVALIAGVVSAAGAVASTIHQMQAASRQEQAALAAEEQNRLLALNAARVAAEDVARADAQIGRTAFAAQEFGKHQSLDARAEIAEMQNRQAAGGLIGKTALNTLRALAARDLRNVTERGQMEIEEAISAREQAVGREIGARNVARGVSANIEGIRATGQTLRTGALLSLPDRFGDIVGGNTVLAGSINRMTQNWFRRRTT